MATDVGGVPVTLGLWFVPMVLFVELVPAGLPLWLSPPQAARAAVRVRTARPWPSSLQFFSIYMSLASLSG